MRFNLFSVSAALSSSYRTDAGMRLREWRQS